jgi:myo-inositol-1(or 4)-monophosphatase
MGSAALDLAWTACGRYDAYYERAVQPWDVAAGRLLCERAGLEARWLQSIRLPDGVDLPEGIVVAPAAIVDDLREIVG